MDIESETRIPTGRSIVYTNGGLVCSASPLAASVGVSVLKEGGNAFDAAIATAAVETVTVSPMCGLGGEVFALLYQAKTGRLFGLTGSGAAPQKATRDYFIQQGYQQIPTEGPLSVAIPGEVDAYATILERFGTIPLAKLLEPAIGYAEEGYPVPPRMADFFQLSTDKLNRFHESADIFTRKSKPYQEGDVLVQKNLARRLRSVAQGGAEEFYRGDLAREIVQAIQQNGGLYTLEEFAAHKTILYEDPISTTYRDYTVYETSPPSQGLLVLELLNILEGFAPASLGLNTAETIHVMVEAKKLAYADRLRYVGDPAFVEAPLGELLSKKHASQRRQLIDKHRTAPVVQGGFIGAGAHQDNTSYFCVIDKEGNAVSFIHSLSHVFGSGFTADNTGILLNNRIGRGFSLEEEHPNVIEPGKRTMHTLNAYMVFKNGAPYLIGGTPGGDSQPQWNVQVISSIIDLGFNVQEAVEAPRWMSHPGTDPHTVDRPFELRFESGIPEEVVKKLEGLGHLVSSYPRGTLAGAVQLIMVDPETGVRMGGSDPRADGQAAAT